MAVEALGLPVNVIVTSGATADCTQAIDLIEGLEAEALIADRAYDTNEILDFAQAHHMDVIIPSKNINLCSYDNLQNF